MRSFVRSVSFLIVAVTLAPFNLPAQSSQDQKPDKDADKKQATAAVSASKKNTSKDEKKNDQKKEEPKKEEEKKPGMNAETFSGLKFRSIGPGVESGRVM